MILVIYYGPFYLKEVEALHISHGEEHSSVIQYNYLNVLQLDQWMAITDCLFDVAVLLACSLSFALFW